MLEPVKKPNKLLDAIKTVKEGATPYKNETLNERENTHGDYSDTAQVAQEIKLAMRNSPRHAELPATVVESLDMIATKMSRIISGNESEPDHWKDIIGYADLGRVWTSGENGVYSGVKNELDAIEKSL